MRPAHRMDMNFMVFYFRLILIEFPFHVNQMWRLLLLFCACLALRFSVFLSYSNWMD